MEAAGGSGGGGYGGYTTTPPTITPEQECDHDYSRVKHDDNIHWSECTKCNSKMENSEDPHTFGEATDDGGTTGTHSATCTFEGCGFKQTTAHEFDANGKCTECDATNTETIGCEHDFSEIGSDDTHHWTKCSKCGEIQEGSKQEHTVGEYENNYDGTHSAKCSKNNCEYETVLIHEFDDDGNCEECEAKACDEGEHDFSIFKWNDTEHWQACKWCEGAKRDSIASHSFGEYTTNTEGKQQAECTHDDCQYISIKESDASVGDLNGDNEINVTDLIILKRHVIAGSKTEWILTENALTLADLNKDGNVDITDIIKLKRTILESL